MEGEEMRSDYIPPDTCDRCERKRPTQRYIINGVFYLCDACARMLKLTPNWED
jgi:hypothetical protein